MATNSHASNHHVVPTFTYVKTLVALTILMLATIFASYVNMPGFGPFSGTAVNQTFALLIACVKAALVIWVFMGVRWATTLTRLWALTGFVWFSLMFIMLGDYGMRGYEQVPAWEPVGDTALPRSVQTPADAEKVLNPLEYNMRPRQ